MKTIEIPIASEMLKCTEFNEQYNPSSKGNENRVAQEIGVKLVLDPGKGKPFLVQVIERFKKLKV